MPPTLTIEEPLAVAPYAARSAVTFRADVAADVAPTLLRYRVYPTPGPAPDYHTRALAGALKSFRSFVTWARLTPGVEYQADFEIEAADGTGSASLTFVWDPEAAFSLLADDRFGLPAEAFTFAAYAEQWLSDAPWYYATDPFTRVVFDRLAEEAQRADAALVTTLRRATPARSDAAGLERWEAILGISPPEDLSLERRLAIVLSHFRTRLNPAASIFAQTLEYMLGYAPRITEDFANYTITVEVAEEDAQALVLEVAARLLPAHLAVNFGSATFSFAGPRRRLGIVAVWPRSSRSLQDPDGLGFDSGRLV